MIIDFHTHTYPEKIAAKTVELLSGKSETIPQLDGTLADLKKSMTEAGVDISVVLPVATSPKQYAKINEVAEKVNEDFSKTGIWSFGSLHPDNDNYKEILRDIADKGLKGIKLHPDYHETFMNDIKYKRILAYATELDLITVVHAGTDIGLPDPVHCTPDMIVDVLDDVKPEKYVLAHMGSWQMWDQVYDKICGRNVYLDTAFSFGDIPWKPDSSRRWKLMNEEQMVKLIKQHGADKVLFATDSPWNAQKVERGRLENLPLTEEEKAKILGDNAKILLKL